MAVDAVFINCKMALLFHPVVGGPRPVAMHPPCRTLVHSPQQDWERRKMEKLVD